MAAILFAASCRATVAAIAALSDSGPSARSWMRTASCSSSRGQPGALGARRRAPAAARSPPRATSAAPARSARAAGREARRSSARAGGRANSDPMLARTALGENGSAQPGPRITGPSASAWAERMIAPTLPGSSTACSQTLRSPPGSDQRCSYTPITRAPEPSVLTEASSSGSTSSPARRTKRGCQPAGSAAPPGPRPRRRTGPAAAPALLRELADRLELVVVGGADHGNKKGALWGAREKSVPWSR